MIHTPLRPAGRSVRAVSDAPAPGWEIPALADDETAREAHLLLGAAWRSPTTTSAATGRGFDVVRAPQPYAAPALDRLRGHGARLGAVTAERDYWTFFVPPGSATLCWPAWAECLGGPAVHIPPRSARESHLSLRWVTRGEPAGRLLTHPTVLWATLCALAPRPAPPPRPRPGWAAPSTTPTDRP